MRHSLRILTVGLMVVALSFHPAAAWNWGCGGCGSHGTAYYAPVYSGCCGDVVSHHDCGGCDPCDDCYPCGGVVVEEHPSEPIHEPAPAPPAESAPPTETHPMPSAAPRQPATVDRPVETTPQPAPPTLPADESNDLFNGTEESAAPEMEEPEAPAEEAPLDLFGEPAEPAAPAESAPVEEPAEAPAEEPADEPFDLFGEPATSESEMPAESEEQPAEEEPAEEQPSEDVDDIFGATRNVLGEPGGLASDEMRVWIDNTGSFSTRGRLVSLQDSHVRLLKDNGRTTTVPLYRLSPSDLEFVHRQASAQQAEAYQTAQSLPTMPGFAN